LFWYGLAVRIFQNIAQDVWRNFATATPAVRE
jgi:hypothetical protein